MTTSSQIASWRAVEALRSGVPNRDAVQALGSDQPVAEQRFRDTLAAVETGALKNTASPGILLAGDFGSGKSHLLEYFQHVALQNNFVCSKVVISKETPLYATTKVFNAAIQSAKVPDRTDTALTAISERIDFDSPEFERFYRWVFSPKTQLNSRFSASLFVFERGRGNRYPEVSDRILQFWGGSRVPESELRSWLRELGEVATYKFEKISPNDLALQRYQFVSRLMMAAGYAGWIILVDEVELIGRYSLLQRAKSYGEMARMLGLLEGSTYPGLATVFAITSAYQSEVMDEKRDEEKIFAKLQSSGKYEDLALASQAEEAMKKIRQIPQDNMVLDDTVDLRNIYQKNQSLYLQAYGWSPPEDFITNNTWRIRQHIKRWINGWDMTRIYPEYETDIQVTDMRQNYTEDLDLEDITGEDHEEWEP